MREVAGLLIVVAVLAVAPALYFSSMIWWVIAVTFVVAGLLLVYSARRVRREREMHALATFDGYAPGPLSPRRLGRRRWGCGFRWRLSYSPHEHSSVVERHMETTVCQPRDINFELQH